MKKKKQKKEKAEWKTKDLFAFHIFPARSHAKPVQWFFRTLLLSIV